MSLLILIKVPVFGSWRNWIIRTIFTWFMIAGFCLIIYGGPLALMITVSLYLNIYIIEYNESFLYVYSK